MQEYKIKYKSNSNVIYSCKYHVIWCPKYRRPLLINGADQRLKNIIEEICDSYNVELFEMEVMPDHVHTLIKSSHILRKEYPFLKSRIPTLRTNSYFISTVGGAPLEIIKQYIEAQKHV